MKKRVLIIGITTIGVIAVIVGLFIGLHGKKEMPKYFIIHGILEYDGKSYTQQASNLVAITLGVQIGITDLEQQVFEIKGQNPTDWVCVRMDGSEKVFRNTSTQHLDLQRFGTTKIIVKEEELNAGIPKTIVDETLISSLMADLKDENLVSSSELSGEVRQLNLLSDSNPGLSYLLAYIHDTENSNCFIYEATTENLWKIGHYLMEALM
jgi:hypothetical protein